MNDKLTAAIAALTAETADTNGKLASIRTFVMGVPALVASAVETALANADVDQETAATEIAAATDAISQNVDRTLAAIDENPTADDEGLPPVAELAPIETTDPATGGEAEAAPAPTPAEEGGEEQE